MSKYGAPFIATIFSIFTLSCGPGMPIDLSGSEPLELFEVETGQDQQGLILITVDTLRADFLGAYGHPRVQTPHLERLASGGQLFRTAIAQSSTTTPSHTSLMTSLYLHDHNVYSNFEAVGQNPATLAQLLKQEGYETFAMVNMRHLNPEVSNLGAGFDTFVRSGNMRRAEESIDEFVKWVDQKQGKKFFAWIHLVDVHTPYRPPPPYDRLYYDGDERDPETQSLDKIWGLLPHHMSDHPYFRTWLAGVRDLEWVIAQYQGAITYVDDQIGRLMDALDDRGILDDTAMVVTSDHGESMGEHDMYFVHTGLYESTVRVPLITYFPGSGRAGVEVHEVVELIDVMPTVLEYLGVETPRAIRGRTLWPLIHGQIEPERIALTEHAGRNLVALRSARYKYIRHLRTRSLQPSYPFKRGSEELYDLSADPGEDENIARNNPELIAMFRRELKERRRERLDMDIGQAQLNKDTLEVLRALGYVR